MKSYIVFISLLGAVCGQWMVDPDDLPSMPNNNSYTCKLWGECTMVNGFMQICQYEGNPLQLVHDRLSEETKVEIMNILDTRCPHLLYDADGNRKDYDQVYTCCSSEQLLGMAESFMLADGVLSRCPSCLRNFIRQICEMNCSPEQSRFLDVETQETDQGLVYASTVNYRMHEDFMLGAHESCSGVVVPQTGMPAINLMCGNAAVCDAEAWFGYSGDVQNNPFAPTQINFLRWNNSEESMNAPVLRCNETSEGDFPCSCIDCALSCPTGQEPLVPDICTALSVHCAGLAVGITVFVLSVTFFAILTVIEYKRMRQSLDNKPENEKPFKIGAMSRWFQKVFLHLGEFSSSNAMLMIMITSWIAIVCTYGALQIQITARPIDIWSSPTSRSREHFDYYNSRFGPFYRASQVFLQFTGLEPFEFNNVTYGPAFRLEAIEELVNLEQAIINIGRSNGGVVLEEVCYAPLRSRGTEPNLDLCVSMSVATYLGDDRFNLNQETSLPKILSCINNYFGLDCLAPWGGGAEPEIALGGYEGNDRYSADTLVLNFPISNYLYEEDLKPVEEWEQAFLDLMYDYQHNVKPDYVEVYYGAERSIEDEIERVSRAEVVPIASSYILMFLYVTVALGKFKSCKTFLVHSKILVGITSIIVEILAILSALGLMGYFGISTTLLSINVIPFFILSVGIDNVFLMVNTLNDIDSNLKKMEDYNENFSFEKKRRFVFGKMMERIGPSIFITSITQITCFSIGTLANFPAVVTFAVFATFSLVFLFIFQLTTIVAILSLDYKREYYNRLDVLFCIRKKVLDDTNPLMSDQPQRGLTERFMGPYANFILNWKVKIVVAIIFMAFFSVCIILIPQLEIGLDQQMALPTDSYVYYYLGAVNELFKLGPPVYFVLKSGLNFSNPEHQNTICGGRLCNTDSLTTQIYLASLYSEVTHIASSSNSWLDDFFDWSSLSGSCCKYNIYDNSFCQSTNTSTACNYCSVPMDENNIRPLKEAFERYVPFFLQDTPTDICNKGGLASYYANVNYVLDEEGRATVQDSNFMAYHIGLGTSKEYITAVKYGYEVSENITKAIKQHTDLDVEVFPYSVFYPFFEQYLSMWSDTFASIGYSMIGVLVITLLISGFNFLTTFTIMFLNIMIVLDLMGIMYMWNIPLNAVSCINLIVSIGISVEFCSHILYAYATSPSPPRERVAEAIKKVGATIITGITFTNIPIIVLSFSYTEIIEVFFFRMFFSLVILGVFHGMVFLPVLLSFLTNILNRR